MDDYYTNAKKELKNEGNCDIIKKGQWLLDIISDMFGCNCKKTNT